MLFNRKWFLIAKQFCRFFFLLFLKSHYSKDILLKVSMHTFEKTFCSFACLLAHLLLCEYAYVCVCLDDDTISKATTIDDEEEEIGKSDVCLCELVLRTVFSTAFFFLINLFLLHFFIIIIINSSIVSSLFYGEFDSLVNSTGKKFLNKKRNLIGI